MRDTFANHKVLGRQESGTFSTKNRSDGHWWLIPASTESPPQRNHTKGENSTSKKERRGLTGHVWKMIRWDQNSLETSE